MKSSRVILLFLATLAPATVPAQTAPPPRYRAFWDAALGGVLSDNVYRDRSQEEAGGYDVRLRAGVRKRYSRRTFAQIHYELDALGYRGANLENRADHGLEGLFRRQLSDPATLELRGGGQISRFPSIPVYDSRAAYAQASVKTYLARRTTLEGGLDVHGRSYPDYDLDHTGVRLFATLAQELNRRTSAELGAVFRDDGYSERRVRGDDSTADVFRGDRDWLASLRLVHDRSLVLRFDGGYRYGRLRSTGGSLETGPLDPTGSEAGITERLPGDDYSHRRHEGWVRVRRLIRRGSAVSVVGRYQDRAYDGRVARDADGQLLVPEQTRRDRNLWLSATWDHPVPGLPRRLDRGHVGFRVRLSREMNSSNEALYDYGSTSLGLALTTWF